MNMLKILAAVVAVALLAGLGFFLGANSVEPELRAAERRGDTALTDLKATEQDLAASEQALADTEDELSEVQSELTDAQAALAACDGKRATEVFMDLMAAYGEFLRQYDRYLGNDELIFIFDFDTIDEFRDGYNGSNSMVEQFNAALESCTSGEGANV